jgi:hypothetical protein
MKGASLALLLSVVSLDAYAVGRLADVQIVDRDTGAILTPYRHRGEYWVAGRPGGRYAISLRNQRGERLLAVTSVDGINVISGETGAWNQRGYVFEPGESYEIAGWRKSDQEIAAFEFTAAPQSYAERTGRPANVGVIGVALFLERPEPIINAPAYAPRPEESNARDAQRGIAAPAAPGASRSAPMKLGTGHGDRETSFVQSTRFNRLTSSPNEVIRIRYDSFDNLAAMGIVHPNAFSHPNPFPESDVSQYVPDPPGGG